MAALDTGIKLKAQLVLLQEPTSKWGIRHPGYRMIWPQEGGNKPRTMVEVRIDGRLRVEYRRDLGQHSMGDLMVLYVTTDTGRKIRVVKASYQSLALWSISKANWQTSPCWMLVL
jgi:hypothetical protein